MDNILGETAQGLFWHVLTEGGTCSNFINTNQNSIPNSLAHTRKT